MKILQWVFPYFPAVGGRERFVQRLSAGLIKDGNSVSFVITEPDQTKGPAPEIEGLDVFYIHPYLHMFPNRSDEAENQFQKLVNFVKSRQIELIHFHNTSGPDVGILTRLKMETGIPVVLTLHGPLGLDWKGRLVPAPSEGLVDTFVSISDYVHEASLETMGNRASNMKKIYNGVEVSPLEPCDIGEGFLYFGRISSEKGIPQMLSAFKLFQELGHDAPLKIIGEGVYRPFIEQVIELMGLKNGITIQEWTNPEDLINEICKHRAVIVPSIWQEPFGLVAIEAMSQARPVIFSKVGALPEIVGPDGKCGIGFESGDIARLVSAMIELHSQPSNALQMGKNGKKRVQDQFAFSDMLQKYESVFSEVIGEADV